MSLLFWLYQIVLSSMCGFTEWLTPCNGYSILFSAMVPPCAAQSGSAYNWSVSWRESRKVLGVSVIWKVWWLVIPGAGTKPKDQHRQLSWIGPILANFEAMLISKVVNYRLNIILDCFNISNFIRKSVPISHTACSHILHWNFYNHFSISYFLSQYKMNTECLVMRLVQCQICMYLQHKFSQCYATFGLSYLQSFLLTERVGHT